MLAGLLPCLTRCPRGLAPPRGLRGLLPHSPVGSLLCLAPLALGLVPSRGLGVGGLPRPAPRPLASTPPLTCPVVGPQMGRCSLAAVRRPAFGSEHSTNLILFLLSVFFDHLSVFEIRTTNFIHPSIPSFNSNPTPAPPSSSRAPPLPPPSPCGPRALCRRHAAIAVLPPCAARRSPLHPLELLPPPQCGSALCRVPLAAAPIEAAASAKKEGEK